MRVGMELAQEDDISATPTQADFTQDPKLLPTSPQLWSRRKEPLLMDEIKMRQCELGDPCRVATAPRPDFRAQFAEIPSRINSLGGSDVDRKNE